MKYDEEIQKLHARVEQLEKLIVERLGGVIAPAPEAITEEYLHTLDQDQITELLKQGLITTAQFGAAFAAVKIKAQLSEHIGELESKLASLPPAAEATQKSSGDGQDAGDWTKAGDGTHYPEAKQAAAEEAAS